MKSLLVLLSLLFTLVLSGCKEGTIVYDIEFPRADSPEAQPIPPVVSLQTSSSNLAENAGTVLVNITLNKTISSTTTVTLSLSGSATLNRDYRIDSTTLQIPAGSLSASTTLRSIDDSIDDDAETIILDIVSVSGGEGVAEAGTQQDIVTITDDEGTPAVTLSTSTYSFSENTTNPAVTLTVAMTIASTDNTTIQLSTSGTATGGGTDYSLTNSTLVIPASSTSMTTTILTYDDLFYDDG
ncbi:MAG: Calx-beta domain-containing protein, partial [bacterium]